jgi:hypothetical protein
MNAINSQVVEHWVQRVFALNEAYLEAIDADPSQKLGPPASEAEIRRIEAKLNVAFPPSYRVFLTLHNGWKGWMGDVDLLSTTEMERGRYYQKIVTWRKSMFEAGAVAPITSLVIGVKLPGQSFLMLDRESEHANGELDVVHWEFDEVIRHESFLACLKARADALEQLLAEETDVS